MDDLLALYEKSFTEDTLKNIGLDWGCAYEFNSGLDTKPLKRFFEPVNAKYIRLTVTNVKTDKLGYDIPNICYFDVYC